MNADAVGIDFVIGVAGDVGALIDDIDMQALLGEDAGVDGTGETRADDQDFGWVGHGREKSGWLWVRNWGLADWGGFACLYPPFV
jgi:hypothetical protein